MSELKKRSDNILAEGEATGHSHQVIGENITVYGEEQERLLEMPNGGTVKHEEHKEITLPPGEYDISIVKEYDHAEESVRNVVD